MSEEKMNVEQLLAKATKPAADAMLLHPFYRGKVETALKCTVRDFNDFAIWYTPGVAAPCKAIAANPELVYEYTNKWNTVAVVSDGTRVLGLGDIGPKAGLPVMEGKALLYKYLGGVDGVAIMVGTKDPDAIIDLVLNLQPGWGGVNLEDISNPKCFYILDTLREKAEIPVWHDDQQGTATVTLAGLINALKVVGKKMSEVKITFIGTGASNVAISRLIFGWGADPAKCLMVDSKGILGKHRKDLEMRKAEYVDKWKLCNITNAEDREGDIPDAMKGAEVVIALSKSGPGVILPEWVKGMAKDSILFACANPVPEIWPWEAKEAGVAVMATGRSDFPNQVNNSLGFPGIFRGTLDVRARTITDEMCFAAAQALADHVGDKLDHEHIMPTMDDWEVFPREAAAVAMKAIEQGLALKPVTYEEEFENATKIIRRSRQLTQMMMAQGFIPEAPEDVKPPEVDVETVKSAY
ncbi:MAG: NADP-dependent malic enzyme [Anaerolineales bacterium]|nr:NADP-dependent malic enzyme [Anaerolineales bacterium]